MSFVRQIAGDKLLSESGESLKESVERDEKKKRLKSRSPRWKAKCGEKEAANRQME